jgi:predicted transposase YdaD
MTYITSIERRGLERGRELGREEGRHEERKQIVLESLEEKFGPLSPKARETVGSWSYDKLKQVTKNLEQTQSLQELGLDG